MKEEEVLVEGVQKKEMTLNEPVMTTIVYKP